MDRLRYLREQSQRAASALACSIRDSMQKKYSTYVTNAPQPFDLSLAMPDKYPRSWNHIIGAQDGRVPALLMTNKSARNIAKAIVGDEDLLRLEAMVFDRIRIRDNQMVDMENEEEVLEKDLEQAQSFPGHEAVVENCTQKLKMLSDKQRGLRKENWRDRCDLADQREDQYRWVRDLLIELREVFPYRKILERAAFDQARLPVLLRYQYLEKRGFLSEYLRIAPVPNGNESAMSAWRKAHPRPRRDESRENADGTEARSDADDDRWRALRLKRYASQREFEQLRLTECYNWEQYEEARKRGDPVPQPDDYYAAELWERVRVTHALKQAEEMCREMTRKLRKRGRHPSTVDSTHVSSPTTDTDIGDMGPVMKDIGLHSRVEDWYNDIPEPPATELPSIDEYVRLHPALYPQDLPQGRLGETPQLYDWDDRSIVWGESRSEQPEEEQAARIRAWRRILEKTIVRSMEEAMAKTATAGKARKAQSEASSTAPRREKRPYPPDEISSYKKKKQEGGMIQFPDNPGYPMYMRLETHAVQPAEQPEAQLATNDINIPPPPAPINPQVQGAGDGLTKNTNPTPTHQPNPSPPSAQPVEAQNTEKEDGVILNPNGSPNFQPNSPPNRVSSADV
ncbi:hypothetical protein EJ08DRAFT_664818 [Tothia fuscella]|uniref:Uncharacterized protein n=1 Tax=Tothia fuscella TaxID=1048955 RepID=A0A9P4NHV8_9PEZI|nr:hypothetical protein EJ08DRAFT_664818 [Tothia fuscella]